MKKTLLRFTLAITTTALVSSLYLATLNNPTDIQKQLNSTMNTIAVAGTTALFALLNDDESNASS